MALLALAHFQIRAQSDSEHPEHKRSSRSFSTGVTLSRCSNSHLRSGRRIQPLILHSTSQTQVGSKKSHCRCLRLPNCRGNTRRAESTRSRNVFVLLRERCVWASSVHGRAAKGSGGIVLTVIQRTCLPQATRRRRRPMHTRATPGLAQSAHPRHSERDAPRKRGPGSLPPARGGNLLLPSRASFGTRRTSSALS